MTFNDFEKMLDSIGEVAATPGAAEHGSNDFMYQLWRCHQNDEACEVHQLYRMVTRAMKIDLEIARLEGYNKAMRYCNEQLRESNERLAEICEELNEDREESN